MVKHAVKKIKKKKKKHAREKFFTKIKPFGNINTVKLNTDMNKRQV